DAEACIPALMLHRQVVLLGVRNAEVRVNGLWERDSRWPRDTGGREDAGQDHCRIVRGISEVWLVDDVGHARRAQRARHAVVEEAEPAAKHRVIVPGAVSKADPWRKVIPISSHQRLAG